MMLPQDQFIVSAVNDEQISYEQLGCRLGCSAPHAWRLKQIAYKKLEEILTIDGRIFKMARQHTLKYISTKTGINTVRLRKIIESMTRKLKKFYANLKKDLYMSAYGMYVLNLDSVIILKNLILHI